jgi:hypothetical protein
MTASPSALGSLILVVWVTWWCIMSVCHFDVADAASDDKKKPRLYQQQFPNGSDFIPMPPTVLFSIYMGEIHYPHIPFLLASMKWNPDIKFVIINIYNPEKTQLVHWKEVVKQFDVPNLHIEYLTLTEFSDRVFDRLHVRIPFTDSWYYKMCDFKPTLAYLFPELSSNSTYKYWGYADLDVVWGNITKFSYLFQNGRPFVISGWWHTTGALNMFINEDWTQGLFMTDPKYIPLLADPVYRNMDENGLFLNEKDRLDNGMHSMMFLENNCKKCQQFKQANNHMKKGLSPDDTLFIGIGEYDWGGHSVWSHGSLTMPAGNKAFPPYRELMFYHVRKTNFEVDPVIRHGLIEDMITYGFTLPHFFPLYTRYACRNNAVLTMENYQPYAKDCFASKLHLDNVMHNSTTR